MKKNLDTKLSLRRETLTALQPDALQGVQGGLVVTPGLWTVRLTQYVVTRLANCR
jgi:hypothetical protein